MHQVTRAQRVTVLRIRPEKALNCFFAHSIAFDEKRKICLGGVDREVLLLRVVGDAFSLPYGCPSVLFARIMEEDDTPQCC